LNISARFRLILLAGLAGSGLAACAQPAPPVRPTVPTPRLVLSPARLQLAPGEVATLVARPQGGEAILFHVDWVLVEGPAGGRLDAPDTRADDGSYSARYRAPATGAGPFHVKAWLREFPAAQASAEVQIKPAAR
jgi:hypothetical protein